MGIKEYYNGIKKKGLPSYEILDSEFDIGCIEEGNFAMKICENISEKIKKYREYLEEYLQADGSSVAVLMEVKGMSEGDKEKINLLYKDLIVIERNLLLAELENKEENYLEFIESSIQGWNFIKADLKNIIQKAKAAWRDESKVREELGYLG